MLSVTPTGRHPDLESNQDQDLRRVLCDPLHHRDGHRPSAKKHECEESNPVRQVWKLPALPGAHSLKAPGLVRPEAAIQRYLASSTFQYASLTNFDQLSIRTSWNA